MKCKKIQELLLTDYLDGEVSTAVRNEVENHVKWCHRCRQFEQGLLQSAVEPLRKAGGLRPPDSVWEHITKAIILEERKQSESAFSRLPYAFPRIFLRSKAAVALATVGVVLLLMLAVRGFKATDQRVSQVQPERQGAYLTDLLNEPEYFSVEENDGYGTAIEEYFL